MVPKTLKRDDDIGDSLFVVTGEHATAQAPLPGPAVMLELTPDISAAMARLRARMARRPGRWRRSMRKPPALPEHRAMLELRLAG